MGVIAQNKPFRRMFCRMPLAFGYPLVLLVLV